MSAAGGPVSRASVGGEAVSAYSPVVRPAYSKGSFERVLATAENTELPPVTSIGGPGDRFASSATSGAMQDRHATEEDDGATVDEAQRFAEMPTWPPGQAPLGTAGSPVSPPLEVASLPPDAEALAAKLDQMGVRLSVRGLSTSVSLPPTQPVAATTTMPSIDSPRPTAPADEKASEIVPVNSEPGEQSSASSGDGTAGEGSDPPSGQGSAPVALGPATTTTPFSVMAAEAVAAVDAAGAIEDGGPILLPDGITVRVVDPDGAWEVDVLRSGNDLSLLLRGSQEVTDSVLQDEATLRNDLARDGWRLAHLRVETSESSSLSVRPTAASDPSNASKNMQSDHPGSRREEAPAWLPPRTARPAPRPEGPNDLPAGRLDREI